MGRRIRRVPVTVEFLIDIMKNGTSGVRVVRNPLPADAAFVGSSFDPLSLLAIMFVSSDAFEDVKEGDPVPEHPVPFFERVS